MSVSCLTTEAADRLRATVRETKKVLDHTKQAIEEIHAELGQGAIRVERRLIAELEKFLPRAERVLEQVRQRFAQERIRDRLVSMFDPDARPIRKGKLSSPTQSGSVVQVTELSANTKRGARGLLLPPTMQVGNPSENELLPGTVAQLALVDCASKLTSPMARLRRAPGPAFVLRKAGRPSAPPPALRRSRAPFARRTHPRVRIAATRADPRVAGLFASR